jgi:Carboxypeptidase regulatory-like domain
MNRFYPTAARLARNKVATLLALLAIAVAPALAQINSGSMSGTVADSSGAVIPNAKIAATEAQTGTAYTTVANSAGIYTLPALLPGSYNVTVTAPSFQQAQVKGVLVYVSNRTGHDFTMQPGDAGVTVTVEANGPALDTQSSDIGTSISQQQVDDLPIATGTALRSLTTLTFLTPGAVGPGTNGGTEYTKIGGGQTFGSDNLIDGLSTQRSENGTGFFDQMTPSVDAIGEFRVETEGLPAYFGRTTGGIASYKTKSGTNDYHGTVFDFFRNTIFDANNYLTKGNAYLNGATQDKDTAVSPNPFRRPADRYQDYGVTLGGPFRIPHLYNGKNKTFFFFSFDQPASTSTATAISTVPTCAQRGLGSAATCTGNYGTVGDFSSTLTTTKVAGLTNPCTGGAVFSGQIYDPNSTTTVNGTECRTAFLNNQVPLGRSAVALKVLSSIPLPNYVGPGTGNYSFTAPVHVSQTATSVRIDQNIGARHHIFGFGMFRENFYSGQATLPSPVNPGSQLQNFYSKIFRVGWDYTIKPNLINQLTVGTNRINSYNSSPPSLLGVNYDSQLGIPNTPSSGTNYPTFNIGENISTLGSSNFDENIDTGVLGDDTVSWQLGRHSLRFGGTYRWQQFSYENNGPAAGYFNFARAQTAAYNNGTAEADSGNGLASFLLGATSGSGRTVQLHYPRWMQQYSAGYVQDDWKALRNLTVNAGFRYSVDTPRHEADGDISTFDPTIPNPAANGILGAYKFGGIGAGRDGNKNEQFAATYFKNFEPRVGFSYAPGWLHNGFVIRSSYTIMYGPLIYADFGQGLSSGFTNTSVAPNTDGFVPNSQLDSGPPNVSLTPTITPSLLVGGSAVADYIRPGDGKPAMVQNWVLETQTQLAPDMILTLGYLGERGTRLRSLVWWYNEINPAYFALGNTLYASLQSTAGAQSGVRQPYTNFYQLTNGLVGQALLPFPQYGYLNNDSYLQNLGQSTYNAMEVKLDRKFRNGLNLLVSYTWSKTFTDADSIQPYQQLDQCQCGTQNPYNQKAERSLSIADVPTNFVASYLYELPIGKGKRFLGNSNRLVNALIGGYRIGGIDRYLSGQPISFFGAQGIPYFDGGIRFDRHVGNPILTPAVINKHYNPFNFVSNPSSCPAAASTTCTNPTAFWSGQAFTDVNDAAHRGSGAYRFGDMPRTTAEVRTPAYFNEDANVNKSIPIHDLISADLRLEVFNVFNRHGFAKPDSGVFDLNFGQVTGLNDAPRSMQLLLKVRF